VVTQDMLFIEPNLTCAPLLMFKLPCVSLLVGNSLPSLGKEQALYYCRLVPKDREISLSRNSYRLVCITGKVLAQQQQYPQDSTTETVDCCRIWDGANMRSK